MVVSSTINRCGQEIHASSGTGVPTGPAIAACLFGSCKEGNMYISSKASRIRQREAQKARDNRAEIVKALSIGQITRRDLFKWGIFTTTGLLACKNGLSPFARSAFADVPTGTPRSPLFGAAKFTQRMPRLQLQTPVPHDRRSANDRGRVSWPARASDQRQAVVLPQRLQQLYRRPGAATRSATRSPTAARWRAARPASSSRISAGTSSSPRSATSCRWGNACPAPGSTRISPTRTRTACGATAPAGSRKAACRRS